VISNKVLIMNIVDHY